MKGWLSAASYDITFDNKQAKFTINHPVYVKRLPLIKSYKIIHLARTQNFSKN